MTEEMTEKYVAILREELIPAMGCTEPIAIAYAGAVAKDTLGKMPDRIEVIASGNIIKNVKSVVVPNTNGLKGIPAAVVAGVVAGNADKKLEVIASVTEKQKEKMAEVLKKVPCEVTLSDSSELFEITVILHAGSDYSKVMITEFHTNIVLIERNDNVIVNNFKNPEIKDCEHHEVSKLTDRSILSVKDIVDFADSVDISRVKDILERQIEYNMAIAEEGLRGQYGANIGKVLLSVYGDDIKIRARAKAAAGSDARMNGCELPVVINSGSGNQGITASVPVIEYAGELKVSDEKMYRALLVSNLITIHLKTGIGRLSAYCGVVSAGCGSGCGIAYLYGGDYKVIAHTIVNALAVVSGIVCDGAKASCAGKIASAVDAGIIGYHMYTQGQQYKAGDGIVKKGVENTIKNVSLLGREGMKETDKEILKLMLSE